MDLGIASRRCVVTGGSRGIGRAAARMLCEAGAKVLLVARGQEDLEAAVRECSEAEAGTAEALALDVTESAAAGRIADAVGGRVDVLVNNAGTAVWRDLDEVPEDDWYRAFELNVMAPKRLMSALLPGMAQHGWGRVVNVSSSAGKRPSGQAAEYSVAKAAMLSLSRLYAERYAARGVLVNALCPGPVKSEMWMEPGGLLDQSRELESLETREQALEAAGAKRPIGRLAEVDEIASVIAFLCSERAGYVAGSAWSADGGSVQVII